MRTVAFVQARTGSTRLPGKVLRDIGGRPMLARVVDRAKQCTGVDDVVVVTSIDPGDDALVPLCGALGVPLFRGSELDVLERYTLAARAHSADVCVRITSDCPLLDPGVSSMIVKRFHDAMPGVDYASNKIPQSFPRGLDTEVCTVDALERAYREATLPYERTHVMPYFYEHPERFRLLSITSEVDRADWRWTVDTAEDLEFVTRVYERLGLTGDFGWLDVVALIEREPQLADINRHVAQKALRDG